MTLRERWLTAAVTLLSLSLIGLLLWSQIRYADAQEAVRRYVRADTEAERDRAQAALYRQARPEVQRQLAQGEFKQALRRLDALADEQKGGDDAETDGKSLSIDALWPPKSPDREAARKLLRLLVEKQRDGYNMEAAQEKLVQVAEAARHGKRQEALKLFQEAGALVQAAELRPGFRKDAPEAAGADAAGGEAAVPKGGALPQISDAQIRQALQFFQLMLPQMLEKAEPEHRPLLARLQPFGEEFAAAYQQGKDLSAVMPLLKDLGTAIRGQDTAKAYRLLDRAQAALRSAPRRGAAPAPATTAAAGKPAAKPAGPPVAAPRLPAVGLSIPTGGAPDGERLLQALDMLRRLPEPVYQQQRPQMAALLAQGLASMAGAPRPPAGTPLAAGRLRLAAGPMGEILTLSAGERELSAGLPAGGFAVVLGTQGELPLRGALKREGDTLTQRVSGSLGQFTAAYRTEGDQLVIRTRCRRKGGPASRAPGMLSFRLPVRSGGWRWQAGGESQVVALDGSYVLKSASGEKLGRVSLAGPGVTLALQADTASAIACEPAGNWVNVQLPLAPGDGLTEHELRLSVEKPGGDKPKE